jgi:uncharacterized protein
LEKQVGFQRVVATEGINPVDLVVIQPTPFCNIDCSYCYLSNRSDKKQISLDTIKAIAEYLRDVTVARPPLDVCWHAGEPLIVPISFYELAFQCFAGTSGAPPVRYLFQTNATLINDEWCEFFKRWPVQIGVSVDGPQKIHDAHRVDRSGRGTFGRVMRGISKLREHEVPFNVISVLTKDSLNDPDAIWQFYKSAGIDYVGFNIDEQEGGNQASTLEPNQHLAAYRSFLSRIAELQESDPTIEVRELDNMFHNLTAPPLTEALTDDNRPGAILNIDVDGNLTTFSPELLGRTYPGYGKFAWGNVHVNSFAELSQRDDFQHAYADIKAGIELCRTRCPYFAVCGGGCPSNKIAEHGTFAAAETKACRFNVQAVADVAIERWERKFGIPSNPAEPAMV